MTTENEPIQLQDFVKTVLVQIVHGVKDAQEAIEDTGAAINPVSNTKHEKFLTTVNMDVAVVATGTEGRQTGIGVAKWINAGTSKETQSETSTTSRVQFDLVVRLPNSPVRL